jgi:hypothetical protein
VQMCASCGREVEADFRFCPGCGMRLRRKIVEYFAGAKELGDGWLRVSFYLTQPQHVRFSFWRSDKAEAVTSLHPQEAQRLADFLNGIARHGASDSFATSVRRSARALRDLVR